MEFNGKRDSKNQIDQTFLELLEAGQKRAWENYLKSVLKRLSTLDGKPEGSSRTDPKNQPDGAKGLHLISSHDPSHVNFSDGSKYVDFDKLADKDAFKKGVLQGIEHGNLKLTTKYKPDGTSFRSVDIATTLKPSSAPIPAY